MERHLKILGLLHVAYGVLSVATAYGALYFVRGCGAFYTVWPHYSRHPGMLGLDLPDIVRTVGLHLAVVIILLGLAGIVAGCGLTGKKRWARVLVTVVAVFILVNFPFGTALGIYTLWVVLKPETRQLTAS